MIRQMIGPVTLVLAGGLLLAPVGGCKGDRGDSGEVYARFQRTSDVTAANVEALGIDVNGNFPSENKSYLVLEKEGSITWRSNAETFVATVNIEGALGEEGEQGVLPALGPHGWSPLIAEDGEKGPDSTVVLLFRTTRLFVFEYQKPKQGDRVN